MMRVDRPGGDALAIVELCVAYDALDAASGESVRGSRGDVSDVLQGIEERILGEETAEPATWAWKARLLTRALENEWYEDQRDDVIWSLCADLAYAKATLHPDSCNWHQNRYDVECTCGAIKPEKKVRPSWMTRGPMRS